MQYLELVNRLKPMKYRIIFQYKNHQINHQKEIINRVLITRQDKQVLAMIDNQQPGLFKVFQSLPNEVITLIVKYANTLICDRDLPKKISLSLPDSDFETLANLDLKSAKMKSKKSISLSLSDDEKFMIRHLKRRMLKQLKSKGH